MLLPLLQLVLLPSAGRCLAGPVISARHDPQAVQGPNAPPQPQELPAGATIADDFKQLSRRAGEEGRESAKERKFPSLASLKKSNCRCCNEKMKQDQAMPIHCQKLCAQCVRMMTTMAMDDPKQWPPECCPKHPIPKEVSLKLLEDGEKEEYHAAEGAYLDRTLKPAQYPECTACGDKVKPSQLEKTPCGHGYCCDCLKEKAMVHAKEEELWPPKCCPGHDRIPDRQILKHLSPEDKALYVEKSKMYAIPPKDRFYCSSRTCGQWFQPTSKANPVECPWCQHQTCLHCKGDKHRKGFVCPKDTEMMKAKKYAETEGYRPCGKCGEYIKRNGGCNHMTCRCGYQFCYICNREWSKGCYRDNYQCNNSRLSAMQQRRY